MQSVSSKIWTCVAVSISYDDNDYTTGTSIWYLLWTMLQFYNYRIPFIIAAVLHVQVTSYFTSANKIVFFFYVNSISLISFICKGRKRQKIEKMERRKVRKKRKWQKIERGIWGESDRRETEEKGYEEKVTEEREREREREKTYE